MMNAGHRKSSATGDLPAHVDWTVCALFLDFDGTLAPIVDRPSDARLSESTQQLLTQLVAATSGATAVLSGRALDDLKTRVSELDVVLSGSHGMEICYPGGQGNTSGDVSRELALAFAQLQPFAAEIGLQLERKPGSIALHYRNHPDRAEACRSRVNEAAALPGLRALHGDMVSEAALAGVDKGKALEEIIVTAPFAGRLPIMLGDDVTDEDGFRAAQDLGGFGLKIGSSATIAQYQVPTMQDALAWLENSLTSSEQ